MYKAVVSGRIFRNDEPGDIGIELYQWFHNDKLIIFDDVEHAISVQVEPDFNSEGDYYFIVGVDAGYVQHTSWEGTEWDVEYDVFVLESIEDVVNFIESNESTQANPVAE